MQRAETRSAIESRGWKASRWKIARRACSRSRACTTRVYSRTPVCTSHSALARRGLRAVRDRVVIRNRSIQSDGPLKEPKIPRSGKFESDITRDFARMTTHVRARRSGCNNATRVNLSFRTFLPRASRPDQRSCIEIANNDPKRERREGSLRAAVVICV